MILNFSHKSSSRARRAIERAPSASESSNRDWKQANDFEKGYDGLLRGKASANKVSSKVQEEKDLNVLHVSNNKLAINLNQKGTAISLNLWIK